MSSTTRQRLRGLGLADAGLALEQQRLRQAQAEEQRRREALVDEVVDVGEPPRERLDVGHEPADLAGRLARDLAHARSSCRPRCCASNFVLQPSQQK